MDFIASYDDFRAILDEPPVAIRVTPSIERPRSADLRVD